MKIDVMDPSVRPQAHQSVSCSDYPRVLLVGSFQDLIFCSVGGCSSTSDMKELIIHLVSVGGK